MQDYCKVLLLVPKPAKICCRKFWNAATPDDSQQKLFNSLHNRNHVKTFMMSLSPELSFSEAPPPSKIHHQLLTLMSWKTKADILRKVSAWTSTGVTHPIRNAFLTCRGPRWFSPPLLAGPRLGSGPDPADSLSGPCWDEGKQGACDSADHPGLAEQEEERGLCVSKISWKTEREDVGI